MKGLDDIFKLNRNELTSYFLNKREYQITIAVPLCLFLPVRH